MSLIHNIHKTLTVASLALNGGGFAHNILSTWSTGKEWVNNQITALNKFIPTYGILGSLCNGVKSLQWDKLNVPQEQSWKSIEFLMQSGLGGLLEVRFSKEFFGQTTHFGLIYPALVLAYGDDWAKDGRPGIAFVATAGLEILEWWFHTSEVPAELHC